MHIRQNYSIVVALTGRNIYQHIIRGEFQRRVSAVYLVRATVFVAVAVDAARRHLEAMNVQIGMLKACRYWRIRVVTTRAVVTWERDCKIVFERKIYRRSRVDI